jgi:hypothetical protein
LALNSKRKGNNYFGHLFTTLLQSGFFPTEEESFREPEEVELTAGVARWSVSGLRRLPAPPPRIMENTALGFANFFTFCSLGATCLF